MKEITAQSFPNTICIQCSISGEINKILFSFTPSGLILFLFLRPGASPLAMCFLPFGHRLCIRISASGSSIHGGISLYHNVFVAPSCRRPNLMYRNFKVCIMATKQPPESPFSKGDLRKSSLVKGAGMLPFMPEGQAGYSRG